MAHRGRHRGDDILAAGQTVRDAAAAAGMSPRTAFRRQADPAFMAQVDRHRNRLVEAATGRLADGMGRAAGVLLALLDHDNPAVRLRAAAKVVELANKLAGFGDLARQLEELEEKYARLAAGAAPPPAGGG